eukprot:jgi/Tetstr1/443130/TSEL_031186.t1
MDYVAAFACQCEGGFPTHVQADATSVGWRKAWAQLHHAHRVPVLRLQGSKFQDRVFINDCDTPETILRGSEPPDDPDAGGSSDTSVGNDGSDPRTWSETEAFLRTGVWSGLPRENYTPTRLGGDHVHHELPMYEVSSRGNTRPCNKYGTQSSSNLPGIMVHWCLHCKNCVMFGVMDSAEGSGSAFEHFHCFYPKMPDAISYDNGCNLRQYALNRGPWLWKFVQILIDEFHAKNHVDCSCNYNSAEHKTKAGNFSLCEQKFAPLAASHMDQVSFLLLMRFKLACMNLYKRERTRGGVALIQTDTRFGPHALRAHDDEWGLFSMSTMLEYDGASRKYVPLDRIPADGAQPPCVPGPYGLMAWEGPHRPAEDIQDTILSLLLDFTICRGGWYKERSFGLPAGGRARARRNEYMATAFLDSAPFAEVPKAASVLQDTLLPRQIEFPTRHINALHNANERKGMDADWQVLKWSIKFVEPAPTGVTGEKRSGVAGTGAGIGSGGSGVGAGTMALQPWTCFGAAAAAAADGHDCRSGRCRCRCCRRCRGNCGNGGSHGSDGDTGANDGNNDNDRHGRGLGLGLGRGDASSAAAAGAGGVADMDTSDGNDGGNGGNDDDLPMKVRLPHVFARPLKFRESTSAIHYDGTCVHCPLGSGERHHPSQCLRDTQVVGTANHAPGSMWPLPARGAAATVAGASHQALLPR